MWILGLDISKLVLLNKQNMDAVGKYLMFD